VEESEEEEEEEVLVILLLMREISYWRLTHGYVVNRLSPQAANCGMRD
jgi:hypothetical protein